MLHMPDTYEATRVSTTSAGQAKSLVDTQLTRGRAFWGWPLLVHPSKCLSASVAVTGQGGIQTSPQATTFALQPALTCVRTTCEQFG